MAKVALVTGGAAGFLSSGRAKFDNGAALTVDGERPLAG